MARLPYRALLALPVDGGLVGGGSACPEAAPEGGTVAQCVVAHGDGGRFAVAAVQHGDGAREARLYSASGGDRWTAVARSQAFEPDLDVFGIAVSEQRVFDEPVVVVDYDFDGSGSVHSFDVVAWDADAAGPAVVAHVSGTGFDRFGPSGGTLEFVGADFSDGAPTCCPNQGRVRTVQRPQPGEWALEERVVRWADVS